MNALSGAFFHLNPKFMKTTIQLFALLALASATFAQSPTVSAPNRKWAVGINAIPSFHQNAFIKDIQFCVPAGAIISYKLNRKWQLESGLSFVKNQFESAINNFIPNKKIVNNLASIELPILFQYKLPFKGIIQQDIELGIVNRFLIQNRTVAYEFVTNEKVSESTKNSFYYHQASAQVGYALSYDVTDRFSLCVKPIFRIIFFCSNARGCKCKV